MRSRFQLLTHKARFRGLKQAAWLRSRLRWNQSFCRWISYEARPLKPNMALYPPQASTGTVLAWLEDGLVIETNLFFHLETKAAKMATWHQAPAWTAKKHTYMLTIYLHLGNCQSPLGQKLTYPETSHIQTALGRISPDMRVNTLQRYDTRTRMLKLVK